MWVCQASLNPKTPIKQDVAFKISNSSCYCETSLFGSASSLFQEIFENGKLCTTPQNVAGVVVKLDPVTKKIIVNLEESIDAFDAMHRYLHNPKYEIENSLLPSVCHLSKKLQFHGVCCTLTSRLVHAISINNIGEICPLVFLNIDGTTGGEKTSPTLGLVERDLAMATRRFLTEKADEIACSQNGQLAARVYVDVISTSADGNLNAAASVSNMDSGLLLLELSDWELNQRVLGILADRIRTKEPLDKRQLSNKFTVKPHSSAKFNVTDEMRATILDSQICSLGKIMTVCNSLDLQKPKISTSGLPNGAFENTDMEPQASISPTPDTETCLIAKTNLSLGRTSIHLGKLEGRLVILSVRRPSRAFINTGASAVSSTPSSTLSRASSISEVSRCHGVTSVVLPPSPLVSRSRVNVSTACSNVISAENDVPLTDMADCASSSLFVLTNEDHQSTLVTGASRIAQVGRLCAAEEINNGWRSGHCSVIRSSGCLRNRLLVGRSAAGACAIRAADSSTAGVLLAGGYTQNGCLNSVELLFFEGTGPEITGTTAMQRFSSTSSCEAVHTPDSEYGSASLFGFAADTIIMSTRRGPQMSCARGRLALASAELTTSPGCQIVFACGGSDGNKDLASVECLSVSSLNPWLVQSHPPTPMRTSSSSPVGVATSDPKGEIWSTALRSEWQSVANLQVARSFAAASVVDQSRVVVLGGQFAGKPLASVEAYDNERNEWSYLPPMMEARTQHSSAFIPTQRLLLAVGGISDTANGAFAASSQPMFESDFRCLSASAEALDYRCSRWLRLPELINRGPLIGGALVPLPSSSGRIMLIGGSDGHSALTQTQIFDPRAWTWLCGPGLSVGRSGPCAVSLGASGLAVIGGYNVEAGGFLNSVEVVNTICALSPPASPWGGTEVAKSVAVSLPQTTSSPDSSASDVFLPTPCDPAHLPFYICPTLV